MRRYTKQLAMAGMFALTLHSGTVFAAPAVAFIPAGEPADAPAGFVEMCQRDHALCEAGLDTVASVAAAPSGDCSPAHASDWLGLARSLLAEPENSGMPVPVADRALGCRATAQTLAPAKPGTATLAIISVIPVIGLPTSASTISGTAARGDEDRIDLSARAWKPGKGSEEFALLRKINDQVNRQVIQTPDIVSVGTDERWNRTGEKGHPAGDCEDIAIEKRARLVEAGFAPDKLFYAVVYRANFGLHTILVARTADGDVVLDSARSQIVRWDQAPYSWIRAQSTRDPMVWMRVSSPQS